MATDSTPSTDPDTSSTPSAVNNEAEQCKSFFSLTPTAEWSHVRFTSYCKDLGISIRPDLVSSRYIRQLESISNDTSESAARRKKAQSLVDKFRKQPSRRKLRTVPSMNVKFSKSHNFLNGNGAGVTVAREITNKYKRPLDGEGDSDGASAKKVCTASSSAEVPEKSDESLFVDNAAIFEKEDESAPATSTARQRSPSFDPTQPTLKYQFACSKRVLVFEEPHCHDGPMAPVGILDPDNKSLKLSKEERDELKDQCNLPAFDQTFCTAIDRFLKCDSTTGDKHKALRKLLNSSSYGDEDYDRSKHAEAEYVKRATDAILTMIESLQSCHWLGHKALQEGWYAVNVWGPLIDSCFLTLDNCTLSRTEIKSKTDNGENKRFDGIVAALAAEQIAEFGAIEVAKDPEAIPGEKEIVDGDKLTVVLGSMLRELLARVEYDMDTGRRLCVVGIQHVGFSMRVLRMHAVTKDVFVIHRGTKRHVPSHITAFDNVFAVMKSIVLVKRIVADSMERVNQFYRRKHASELDREDHYRDFEP